MRDPLIRLILMHSDEDCYIVTIDTTTVWIYNIYRIVLTFSMERFYGRMVMKKMMKILSRIVLIAAFGILFSFMAETEVKADDLEFVSASIDAPSQVVKGQSYNIPFTHTHSYPAYETEG